MLYRTSRARGAKKEDKLFRERWVLILGSSIMFELKVNYEKANDDYLLYTILLVNRRSSTTLSLTLEFSIT